MALKMTVSAPLPGVDIQIVDAYRRVDYFRGGLLTCPPPTTGVLAATAASVLGLALCSDI